VKAHHAQEAIDSELALDAGVFDARTITAPCLRQRLRQVASLVAQARRSGTVPDVAGIKATGGQVILTAAWEEALADGTASHIRPERRRTYGLLYPVMLEYRRQLDEEARLWTHLRLLQHAAGRISDPLLTDIASSTAEASYRGYALTTAAEQMSVAIHDLGIQPDYGMLLGSPGTIGRGTRGDVLRQLHASKSDESSCAPVIANGKPVEAASPSS
jgi:hypothetical protein